MIISHKHKFIFLKPTKVAGTSIEIALGKNCSPDDIITPVSEYRKSKDSDYYLHDARNYEDKGFFNHILPNEIKQKIGSEVWDNYYKITVIRNPWDQCISRYRWEQNVNKLLYQNAVSDYKRNFLNFTLLKNVVLKRIRIRIFNFEYFINNFESWWANTNYYFDENDNKICDYYIRYENLEEDFEEVCKILKIPYTKLPKTKNQYRSPSDHYRVFFDSESKQKVENIFKKEIKYFGYKF